MEVPLRTASHEGVTAILKYSEDIAPFCDNLQIPLVKLTDWIGTLPRMTTAEEDQMGERQDQARAPANTIETAPALDPPRLYNGMEYSSPRRGRN